MVSTFNQATGKHPKLVGKKYWCIKASWLKKHPQIPSMFHGFFAPSFGQSQKNHSHHDFDSGIIGRWNSSLNLSATLLTSPSVWRVNAPKCGAARWCAQGCPLGKASRCGGAQVCRTIPLWLGESVGLTGFNVSFCCAPRKWLSQNVDLFI